MCVNLCVFGTYGYGRPQERSWRDPGEPHRVEIDFMMYNGPEEIDDRASIVRFSMIHPMRRVAISGMGLVTALGSDLATSWERLIAGESGIGPITYFDATAYACRVAAEVRLPADDNGLRSVPLTCFRRGVNLFCRAMREAIADAGLFDDPAIDRSRIGVAVGTSVNYLHNNLLAYYYRFRRPDAPELDLQRFAREGAQPEQMFYKCLGDWAAAVPAKMLGLGGPNLAIDTACAASAHAVGEAFRRIRRGSAAVMIVGGGSGLVTPGTILAFQVLGALSRNPDPQRASRPFDRKRDGFVMGEGGGALVLEDLDHARARGARIHAELVGFGATTNAHSLTDPSPDGVCEEQAMRLALADASLQPEDIDYVAAHGTSTPKNDIVETEAIKRVFGGHARRLAVSSIKGQIGHTISAAGVMNLIVAAKTISDGCIPPTINYHHLDPVCDLDYVPNECRRTVVRAALANTFAFGGQNAILAVRAA